jgi:CMP-N,N'-diacetyllegionaminic acid synthase
MSTIGIVPARGGSKGLPGKHLLDLGGEPMIDRTLRAASESERIDLCILTTDSTDICERARHFKGVYGYMRSSELARDDTPTEDVMDDVISFILSHNHPIETIVLLQPTSPLRTGRHIDEALAILEETRSDSLVAVVPSHAFLWRGDAPLYDPLARPRRQDMDGTYEECGAIYATSLRAWERSRCRMSGKIALYVMEQEHRVQVDEQVDLTYIDALLAQGVR